MKPVPDETVSLRRRNGMLVAERGLKNTKRNRRWVKLVDYLKDHVSGGQEEVEQVAWMVLSITENTL